MSLPKTMRLCAALVLACAALPAAAAPLDAAALDQGAELAYRRALQPAAAERRLNTDRDAAARVRGIANRVIVGASTIDPGARLHSWATNVVTAPAADALVYPGGRLLVQSGLLATGFTDEEVGTLLAHVLAHALLGHDRRQLEGAVPAAEAQAADPNRRALAIAGALPDVLKRTPTDAEIAAADRASVELLARGAYAPMAAASAWRKLAADTPLARRYPVNEPRLAALEAAAAAVQPLFEETRARAEAIPRQAMPATTGTKRGVR